MTFLSRFATLPDFARKQPANANLKYFMEPQMRPNEPDEPGSEDYNRRLWRRTRNEKVLLRTQPLKEVASKRRWDNALAFFNNGNQPTKLCFHQFEDHLAVMDDKDGIWYSPSSFSPPSIDVEG